MPDFIPGLVLGELFYREAVMPILDRHFPGLPYAAALVGSGSEVLGYDTPMSTDHHWGPRLLLFLNEADYDRLRQNIHDVLAWQLPYTFRGYSTHFTPPNPDDNGTQLLQTISSGPVNHRVEMLTLRQFFKSALDFDLDSDIEPADWLTFPQQRLLGITRGAVYHDDVGLEAARARFTFYPRDLWLYLLASGWARIGQEEPFVGRTGSVGDDVGSQVLAARLCRDVIRLAFLMERQYAPYSKWLGTAFARLDCAPRLLPLLRGAMLAQTWHEREECLSPAYETLAQMHNALGVTEPLPTTVSPFFGRPFQVIHGDRFAAALQAAIEDETLRRLPLIGSIDQFSDSTDLLENIRLRQQLKQLYTA
ncbi:MAG: DUF4037 domain-containing protein [Chloroflexi bacterium]|nr:DUF4037 domain-containing protein [Chloroflexota bacterium]